MRHSGITFLFGLLLFWYPLSRFWSPVAPEVQRLQREIDRRSRIMGERSTDASVRAAMENAAALGLLSEEAIFDRAKAKGLAVAEAEINTFLLPMLAQQGLVDFTCSDVFQDENVRLWLTGQGMTPDDLKRSGKALALWAKIATEGVVAREDSVKQFVMANPGMARAGHRVRITLSRYMAPPGANTRGVLPGEIIAPTFAIQTRSAAAEAEAPVPVSWANIKLYLELDKIDSELREVLGGKQPGYRFGPMLLSNGATVEGTLDAYIPAFDLTTSAEFWQMAAIRYRLQKADQAALFEAMVNEFIDGCEIPAVRGFWNKIWRGLKKGVSYITGGAGGLIGYFAGGPKGAMMGAKYGYQLGNTIKGWFSTKSVQAPNWSQGFAPAYSTPIPPEYLAGNRFGMPAGYFQRQQYNPYQPQYTYLPAMPADYRQRQAYPDFPPQETWAPQLFFGSPVGYYY